MKESLKPGLTFTFEFPIPPTKTVPRLYPEAAEFQLMPEVLATGFMVGLIEWTCIQAVNPYLDWPVEQSVGIHVNLSHSAPTPPGLTVRVEVILTKVEGRKLTFQIHASDGIETISEGTHERFIIDAQRFEQKVTAKAKADI
jgi:fluoroacetyl-CoA thioesterase